MFECKYVCVCVCIYNNIPFSNAIPAFSCPINTKPNITKIAPVNTNKIARIINAGTIPLFVHMMKFVEYVCDYGSLKVDNVNNLSGNGDYLSLRLGNVYKSVRVRANYGSFKIDRMASKAKNIDIDSEFMGITIGYDSNYSFDFNINLEYASLRDSDAFNFTNKEVDSFEKKYNGYHGTKGSGNYVKIKSQYGSVSFKQQ